MMKGRSSKQFSELRERLLKILASVEAKIDFPEEDLPKKIYQKLKCLKFSNGLNITRIAQISTIF